MKKFLLFFVALLATVGINAADKTVTIDFSAQGYENETVVESVAFDENVSATFEKGTNVYDAMYFNVGSSLRMYGGNSMTLTAAAGVIKSVDFTFSDGEGENSIKVDNGTFDGSQWTGSSSSIKFTIDGTSNHRRIKTISVSYEIAVEGVSIVDADNTVLDNSTYTLELGKSVQLSAVLNPANATTQDVSWEVMQNTEVITFEDGLVTAVGEGQAAVVVTTKDGEKQAFVYIYVPAPTPEKEATTFEFSNNGLDVTITPSNDNTYTYVALVPELKELYAQEMGITDTNTLFDTLAGALNLTASGEMTFNVLEDYLEYIGLEELAPGTEVEVLAAEAHAEGWDVIRDGEITTYKFVYGGGSGEADNVTFDPAPGEIDFNAGGKLDQVTLTFEDAGMVELNDNIPFKANIEDETGREVDSMYGVHQYFLGMNQACITFNKGVTADGTYTINIPAGMFTLVMPDGNTKASSELHATYIVTGAGEGPAPGGKMQILPAEGNVTSLQQFTLVINDWDSQFDYYESKAKFYKNGEFVEDVAFDYNPDDWFDANLYGSLAAPVTEEGTYTLEFPVGSMTTNSWASSNTEPVVYTWTIGGGEELTFGTYAAPIALQSGKTYGLNAAETGGIPNFYTFESDKDVKVILTPTEGSIVESGFAVSTGNFLMDDQYNDLKGAEQIETMMEPVGGNEPGIGGGDDELGGDFGWGMTPGRMATTWTAKAGVKYYILSMGQGSFTVALGEPEEYVGTMDTPINLNETPEWTWGVDGKMSGSATYYTYTAEKDGDLTIFVSNCAENQLHIGEGGWYDAWVHTEGPKYTGEIKTEYNWGALTETNTFAVEAGTTYFITIFDLYGETIKADFKAAASGSLTADPKEINFWGFTPATDNYYYNTHKAIFHVEAKDCTEKITYVMKSSGKAKGSTTPRISVATSGLYEANSGNLNVTCSSSKATDISDVVVIKSGDVEENVTVNVKVVNTQYNGEGIYDEEWDEYRPFTVADINSIHTIMPKNTTFGTDPTHEFSMYFPKLRYFQGVVKEISADAADKVSFTLADAEGDAIVKVVDAQYKDEQEALKVGYKVILSGDFGDVEGELQILTSTIESVEVVAAGPVTTFKWANVTGDADYVAEAGTIEFVGADSPSRLNYANKALDVNYMTICLNGKKGDLGKEGSNGNYMKVTPTQALKAGDVIAMTAYRNKDATGKKASAALIFDNGASAVIGADPQFPNLNAAGEDPTGTPATIELVVTEEMAGAESFNMTRQDAGTNLFITSLIITSAPEEEVPYGTYEAPIALEEGKTYGLNFMETEKPNYYTFESDKDVKVILTPSEGAMAMFGVTTGNFWFDPDFNDLEGAEDVMVVEEPVESDDASAGDDEFGGDFGWGMGPGRMATTWTAKAGVKYYIIAQGQGTFDVALGEPEEYVGTVETPINLNETPEWTWGVDGKLPGNTTYYTYTAEKDGNLTIFVSNCAENQLSVGEGGWYDQYVHTDGPAYTGEIKTEYDWVAWTENNTFAVEAGTTYFITIFDLNGETIKATFTEGGADAINGVAADKANTNVYNVRGQKVDANTFRGIMIKKGMKVIKK